MRTLLLILMTLVIAMLLCPCTASAASPAVPVISAEIQPIPANQMQLQFDAVPCARAVVKTAVVSPPIVTVPLLVPQYQQVDVAFALFDKRYRTPVRTHLFGRCKAIPVTSAPAPKAAAVVPVPRK